MQDITPLHKKGAKNDRQNYRPVSLTSVVCKVCELIVRQQLVQFWITNNVFIPEQFGFLKGKSCLFQLLSSFHDWARARNKGLKTDVIFLDLSKLKRSIRCHMNAFWQRYMHMVSKVHSCLGLEALLPIDTSTLFCGDVTHLGPPFCVVFPKEPSWDPFYFLFILMIFGKKLCQTQNSLRMI